MNDIFLKSLLSLACSLLCCSSIALAQQAVSVTDATALVDAAESKPQSTVDTPIQVRAPVASDTLVLESTSVTGTRELPKVLYIVPWKKAALGELPSQPFNSVLDETLMPLDRDVFRREVTYYETAQPADQAARR